MFHYQVSIEYQKDNSNYIRVWNIRVNNRKALIFALQWRFEQLGITIDDIKELAIESPCMKGGYLND